MVVRRVRRAGPESGNGATSERRSEVPSQLSPGVYRRDFDNGIALNNSSTSAQTIQLGGSFKKLQGPQNPSLNNGATVTSVTIPAHDGLVLLRTGGAPPPPPPPPPPSGTNLALGKPATASSVENSTYAAGKANDGSSSTRWASLERNGEWWQVDLGSTQSVSSVSVNWETAYASRYQIQTSTDGSTFTTVADVTNTSAGTKTTTFTATNTRYVRIVGVTRGTPYGISIWEAQVFGTSSPPPTSASERDEPRARKARDRVERRELHVRRRQGERRQLEHPLGLARA